MPFFSFLNQPVQPTRFIPGSFTLATLPAATDNTQMYAWATDLHDGNPDYVISNGLSWKPVRPLSANVVANGNQNMTFTCMQNSPTQIIRGTLSAIRTLSFVDTYAYSGARLRIKREATGLLALNILAAVTTSLSASSWADFEFVPGQGWVQTASGGLL